MRHRGRSCPYYLGEFNSVNHAGQCIDMMDGVEEMDGYTITPDSAVGRMGAIEVRTLDMNGEGVQSIEDRYEVSAVIQESKDAGAVIDREGKEDADKFEEEGDE